MSAAVVTPLRAQAQQPPQPAQQPEQQLIAGQLDPLAIPAYLQPAPTPALHKAQRTPNRCVCVCMCARVRQACTLAGGKWSASIRAHQRRVRACPSLSG